MRVSGIKGLIEPQKKKLPLWKSIGEGSFLSFIAQ